jgi:hypothetical protein
LVVITVKLTLAGEPLGVTDDGEKAHVVPCGRPLQLKDTP